MFEPGDTIQGFNAPKTLITAPRFNRSLGAGHMFGAIKAKTRGLNYTDKFQKPLVELNASQQPVVINRKERRKRIAAAPRGIRLLIRKNRWLTEFAHKPHPSYWGQYVPEEEMLRLKEPENADALEAAKRYIKNALKRQRQGRV